MSTFEVGEIAIFYRPGNPYHGIEVTIVSPLQFETTWDEWGTQSQTWAHRIASNLLPPRHLPYGAPVVCLRKRRPPPDWRQLCKLDEVPADCVSNTEVLA